MAIIAVAAPVPPDKVEQHQQFLDELNGSRRAVFEAVHRQAGVRERGFIQPMPDGGYLYITVFEGEDPETMLSRLVAADMTDPAFAGWLFQQMQEIHGLDASQGPPPLPQQVLDSGPLPGNA